MPSGKGCRRRQGAGGSQRGWHARGCGRRMRAGGRRRCGRQLARWTQRRSMPRWCRVVPERTGKEGGVVAAPIEPGVRPGRLVGSGHGEPHPARVGAQIAARHDGDHRVVLVVAPRHWPRHREPPRVVFGVAARARGRSQVKHPASPAGPATPAHAPCAAGLDCAVELARERHVHWYRWGRLWCQSTSADLRHGSSSRGCKQQHHREHHAGMHLFTAGWVLLLRSAQMGAS